MPNGAPVREGPVPFSRQRERGSGFFGDLRLLAVNETLYFFPFFMTSSVNLLLYQGF